jgi:lipoprotein-anchoring transpeptidase ErfK/SrfK
MAVLQNHGDWSGVNATQVALIRDNREVRPGEGRAYRPDGALEPPPGDIIDTTKPFAARRRLIAPALVGLMLLTGCGPDLTGTHAGAAEAPASARQPAKAVVAISPADGAAAIRPDQPVTVTAASGTLEHVDLITPRGTYVPGNFNANRTSWTSATNLPPGRNYVVDASAINSSGVPTVARSTFSTLAVSAAERLAITSISPRDGSQVGVAYPLVVTFNRAIYNRREVSDALAVETTPHVDGSWYWIDAQTVDYRPQGFWAPGTLVTVHAKLIGIDGGKNLWGTANTTSSFTVARSQTVNIDLKSDRMSVVREGKVIATFPVSGGKPGWETRDGTKVIMEKVTDKTWTSEAIHAPEPYVKFSNYAMRMTDSGEFIHDAPWNAGKIGDTNASHGCVGMLTDDMKWLFDNTMVGDAVVVTGSPRPFTTLWNRYQDWNVPWERWLTGNYSLTDG